MQPEINNDKPIADDLKSSSVIGLITNYKRKGMFEARLVEKEDDDKKYIYLKVGHEDFYIDLDENDILSDMFSEHEMASLIEELIIENLRLESNLRAASQWLTTDESTILELSAKGYNAQQLCSKTGLSSDTIETLKGELSLKLNKSSFEEALEFIRIKKL